MLSPPSSPLEHPGSPTTPDDGRLRELVASTLGILLAEVDDELAYQSVPEWDSLRHVELMLALERAYGLCIDASESTALRSLPAIRRRILGISPPPSSAVQPSEIARGLEGVVLDRSSISRVDGRSGTLHLRGYAIEELVTESSFEEVVHLLCFERFPSTRELTDLRDELAAARALPEHVRRLVAAVVDQPPMEALAACLPGLASGASGLDPGLTILARIPSVLFHLEHGPHAPAPDEPRGFAAFLHRAVGAPPHDPVRIRRLDRILVLLAEHGCSASTLAGRIAASTEAPVALALTAALCCFAGARHGGAAEAVAAMLEDIRTPERVMGDLARRRAAHQPIMGFGHRVYRSIDPRARLLRELCHRLAHEHDEHRVLVATLRELERQMEPQADKGVCPNVDLYLAAALAMLGIPKRHFGTVFTAARTSGWLAHIREQHQRNVLIRPTLEFVGPAPRRVRRGVEG